MENFLVIIIIIAFIVYKIYKNFMQESEKAKKRNFQQKPVVSIPFPEQPTENIVLPKNTTKTKQAFEPDYFNPIIDKKNIDNNNNNNNTGKPIKNIQIEELNKQLVQFDLRQAVIQSIILERPYK